MITEIVTKIDFYTLVYTLKSKNGCAVSMEVIKLYKGEYANFI